MLGVKYKLYTVYIYTYTHTYIYICSENNNNKNKNTNSKKTGTKTRRTWQTRTRTNTTTHTVNNKNNNNNKNNKNNKSKRTKKTKKTKKTKNNNNPNPNPNPSLATQAIGHLSASLSFRAITESSWALWRRVATNTSDPTRCHGGDDWIKRQPYIFKHPKVANHIPMILISGSNPDSCCGRGSN